MPTDVTWVTTVVAENLKALMEKYGLTEAALSNKSKVAQKTINNIRNCRSNPTVDKVEALAGAFDIEPWQMLVPNQGADVKTTTDSLDIDATSRALDKLNRAEEIVGVELTANMRARVFDFLYRDEMERGEETAPVDNNKVVQLVRSMSAA